MKTDKNKVFENPKIRQIFNRYNCWMKAMDFLTMCFLICM